MREIKRYSDWKPTKYDASGGSIEDIAELFREAMEGVVQRGLSSPPLYYCTPQEAKLVEDYIKLMKSYLQNRSTFSFFQIDDSEQNIINLFA